MKRACADCGTVRKVSPDCLPEGQYRCHPCRRERPTESAKTRRGRVPQPRTCQRCEEHFTVPTRSSRRYCDRCYTLRLYRPPPATTDPKARRQARALADYNQRMRKRARYFGVAFERVDPAIVHARDAWRCGICGGRVDRRCKSPHPRSATIDHVVPMSLGGGHTYQNVQSAHWQCNVRKAATGVGDQLALIG